MVIEYNWKRYLVTEEYEWGDMSWFPIYFDEVRPAWSERFSPDEIKIIEIDNIEKVKESAIDFYKKAIATVQRYNVWWKYDNDVKELEDKIKYLW